MTRSTKLYQKPGSPLIQGHSKTERSFVGEWVRGLLVCCVVAFVVYIYLELDPQVAFGMTSISNAVANTFTRFVPGAIIGTLVGVPVGRGFGWRQQWQAAAVLGLVFGFGVALVLGSF